MRYSDTYSISLLCKVLHVSRSSFYHYFYYSSDVNSSNKVLLISRILDIYYDSKCIYGAPRITKVLNKEGINISVKTVSKYMHILGIQSLVASRFPKRKNSMSDKEKALIINLIKHLNISHPNQVWVTDITYIKTSLDGWVYLSSIIDLFSRKVIAWNVGRNMKKSLLLKLLIRPLKIVISLIMLLFIPTKALNIAPRLSEI